MTDASDTVPATTQVQDGPRGIGGWLILPIIGLVGTIAMTGFNLYSALAQWDGIKAIIAGSNEMASSLRLPVGVSFIGGIALIGMAALCLYRLFTRAPSVPRLMTIFYIALITVSFTEMLADYRVSALTNSDPDPNNVKDLVRACVAAAIWIPYFHRSRRVANTFRSREAAVDRRIGEIF
ncbi:DUF2569 domain-containing protein [Labrys neptuniae]